METSRMLVLYIVQENMIMAWTSVEVVGFNLFNLFFFFLKMGPKRRIKDNFKDFGLSK